MPAACRYEIVLSFVAGDSLDQAVLKSDEISTGPPDFHTPRRSRTAHYGCVRHALLMHADQLVWSSLTRESTQLVHSAVQTCAPAIRWA